MITKEYQRMSKRTLPSEGVTRRDLLANMSMGLAGESGEVVDLLKKHLYQDHDLDVAKVSEEVGDLMWYVANLCNVMNIDMGDCMEANVDKLRRRYPNGFDAERSINKGLS